MTANRKAFWHSELPVLADSGGTEWQAATC